MYEAFNEQDEARFIVDRLQDWFNHGNQRSESAVLYRSNAQSRELEDALLRVGMPYRIYGGHRFYERLEIKNALSYLRMLVNRNDDTAIERVINVPPRGIGGRTIDTIRTVAREQSCSLWQACAICINESILKSRAANAVLGFMELIDKLDEDCVNMELHEKAELVIKQSGIVQHHEKEGGEKARSRIENLEELVNACANFDDADIEVEEGEGIDLTSKL